MSIEIQSIFNAVRQLTPEQRRELSSALESIDVKPTGPINRQELVRSIRGKYRYLPTSSEAFLQRKAEETAAESES